MVMNNLQKEVTITHTPHDHHKMKQIINNALKTLSSSNRLNLKPTKYNTIVDFISFISEMISKAVICNNIINGFKTIMV